MKWYNDESMRASKACGCRQNMSCSTTCITPDLKLVATETTHSQEHLHKHPVPMARYQGQNKKGTPFVMSIKSNVPCHLILQTYVIFQLEL